MVLIEWDALLFVLMLSLGARFSGAAIGVAMGCLLGMIPLFFFDHKPKEKVELSV